MPPVLCGKGVTDLVTYTDFFVFCTLIVSLINLFVQIFQCAYRLCSATRQIVIYRWVERNQVPVFERMPPLCKGG